MWMLLMRSPKLTLAPTPPHPHPTRYDTWMLPMRKPVVEGVGASASLRMGYWHGNDALLLPPNGSFATSATVKCAVDSIGIIFPMGVGSLTGEVGADANLVADVSAVTWLANASSAMHASGGLPRTLAPSTTSPAPSL